MDLIVSEIGRVAQPAEGKHPDTQTYEMYYLGMDKIEQAVWRTISILFGVVVVSYLAWQLIKYLTR
jgi:hypothetical protein